MMQFIVLTKKWGRNFSGATLATQYLTRYWKEQVDVITVLTLECGEYDRDRRIKVIRCKNSYEMKRTLKRIRHENKGKRYLLGYSDDHLGSLFYDSDIPYFHTYHGNWPDARYTDAKLFCKSFYFIPLYKKTIRHAQAVVNVSQYMMNYTKRLNPNSIMIRNGIDHKKCKNCMAYKKTFLMVGNISSRKYRYALPVAKHLMKIAPDIRIHIYGKVDDKQIAARLCKQPNVKLMGERTDIPYKAYCGLINTSSIENLPMSVCEAIKNGIPSLAFMVGGIPEVVIEGKTGCIIEAFNCKVMAEKINNYISEESSMEVDASVLEKFNWGYAASEYWKLFQAYFQKGARL